MNSYSIKQALELFLALFALYSPFAALPSYLPTLGRVDRKEHVRLAVALFVNVAVISLVSLWIGEKLLVLSRTTTRLPQPQRSKRPRPPPPEPLSPKPRARLP